MAKYKRILLKLSGESLMGEKQYGIDEKRLAEYAEQIKEIHEQGIQIGIVIGGGNIFRGLSGASKGFDRVKGDQMGMLATVINSLALSSALVATEVKARVLTAVRMEPIGEFYSKWKAIECMENGEVVIMSAGTGNPFFTTDTGSSLRGIEIEADVMLKGTRVDGIYTADPEKDPTATKFDDITYDEVLKRGLKVMDLTATCMCKENNLPIVVFDMDTVGNLKKVISGRETLEDVNMIVYCGGFSNSDVLGSAKGWAGAFLFNPKAKEALDKYYAREDTLSLGVCNGCQLMMELNLINPELEKKGKMLHNDSHKFESRFLGLTIPTNRSVMFGSLSGSKLGIWVAHGEGKFSLPYDEDKYNVVAKYSYDEYPANPNGSDYSVAALASADGRHLAIMPHLERSIFPWQNGCYPTDRKNSDQVTPWIEAFVNAHKWIETKMK